MSYRPVTSALRVLDVLTAVNRAQGNATVGEVHRLTGLDKATIVRMLNTLASAGYIIRGKGELAYRVTGKTLQLSAGYQINTAISAIISDDLHEFRRQIGWPSDVALFDNDAMIVVQTSRQAEPMQFSREAGYRAPILTTSIGLTFLAFCKNETREQFLTLARERSEPEFALAHRPKELEQKLASVRAEGCATMDDSYSKETYDSQFFSLGVPVMRDDNLFCTMNVIYLRSAMGPAEAKKRMLGPLKEIAGEIATKLEKFGASSKFDQIATSSDFDLI